MEFDWSTVEAMAHRGSPEGDTPRWLLDNVRPYLDPASERLRLTDIGANVVRFVDDDPDPQFWGWYADYDWVVFCWLQGRMIDLPKGWPKYCRDLKQVVDQLGVKIPPMKDAGPEHNALADARDLRSQFEWVREYLQTNDVDSHRLLS